MRRYLPLAAFVLAFALLYNMFSPQTPRQPETSGPADLSIAAGSESKEIEPLIQRFAQDKGVRIQMVYKGSVDMMMELQAPDFTQDAVLPANSMWLRLGDRERRRVKDEASIMRSPVVLGLKRSKAQALGFIGRDVRVADILKVVRAGKLRFGMTSATQSNSGASAYMGLLTALAGSPDTLTLEHLNDETLRQGIRDILAGVDRSSGSSGWLKDMFLQRHASLDGMINYESMVIAANRELAAKGQEPLYVVYPVDGLAIADSTLAFVDKPESPDNAKRRALFNELKDYLLSDKTQQAIFELGFRTGLIGMNPQNVDTSVYNPEWGIDLARTISPIAWPRAEVIEAALRLYQTVFRKPSFTVYLLDVSGSMAGQGLAELKTAMAGVLDQAQAGRYLLETSERDVTAVLPFNEQPRADLAAVVQGNRPEQLQALLDRVQALEAGGGTNIYAPVIEALKLFQAQGGDMNKYLPAVVLMTDGRSNDGALDDVRQAWRAMGANFELPPVFCVTFGDADETQLSELARYSVGRVFDGRAAGLAKAFRLAKGYN